MDLFGLIGPIENTDPQPLSSRKAILWGRDDLLAQAVSTFLKRMAWDVIRVPNSEDVEYLIQETRQVKPDVVILCQEKANEDSSLPWRLIDEQLCLKVVTVGMDSNLMHVYSKQNVMLQGASDMLSIIEPMHLSNCSPEKEVGPPEGISKELK